MKKKQQLAQGQEKEKEKEEKEEKEEEEEGRDDSPATAKVDLSGLSVRELRALLERHKIDYTGAIEKEDLVALAKKNDL